MDKKPYDPSDIEQKLYKAWEDSGLFAPGDNPEAYSLAIPPPNVTGTLHMGHGFQNAIMDCLIRYYRMSGKNTLWQVGTDHAGIATEMVVERRLNAEGKTKSDIGREAFEEEVWNWKKVSGNKITSQLRRLGSSLDWSSERFTLDEEYQHAVLSAFIQLFEEGLIYQGKRLVNWDPVLETSLSDLEVVNKDLTIKIWEIKYQLEATDKFVTVATTRPETLLGDMALAVNPSDKRFSHLIGKKASLPLCNRLIPIVADSYVDPEFGTGVVKITPGHDFNDYDLGKRHGLHMDEDFQCHSGAEADFVLRFPADNFAPEPSEIDRLIEFHISENPEGFTTNLTNVFDSGYPDGIGAEMFNFYNLEKAWKNPTTKNQKEHVHLNFFDYSSESIVDKKNCPVKTISCPIEFRRPDLVLDVNEKCQFTYARSLYEALYPINNNFTILDIIEWHDNVYSQK